jgi:UDP-N-acetylmuramate dehydrogenase
VQLVKDMRRIIKNYNLLNHNTFGIEVFTDFFFAFTDIVELKAFLKNDLYEHLEKRVLGGGSNVLFTDNFHGAVIHPICNRIEVKKKDTETILIKADAGLNWDTFVEQCINNEWFGLENLSGIPGSVGASPIQNIGAYGVEVKDFIYKVEGVNLETHEIDYFYKDNCKFGYRTSIFKQELKDKYVITAVFFKLKRKENLQISYAMVQEELKKYPQQNAANLRKAILDIRAQKLPKIEEMPNAGSFFKNPVISEEKFQQLKISYQDLPSYPELDHKVKIPAGWLIEKCGLKGYQNGNTAVHDKQALVLINKGSATGADILRLADKIAEKVKTDFGIELEKEVNVFP